MSNKKNKKNISPLAIDYPKVTAASERFDISNLNKNDIKTNLVNKDTIYQIFRQDAYIEETPQKNVIKSFFRLTGGDGTIAGYDYSGNPILGLYKKFYRDGSIMEKGGFC